MNNLSVVKITNTDKGFYNLLGRVLSRRDIVKENGDSPIWDDDGKIWWAAVLNGIVIGFVTSTEKASKVTFNNDYMHPDYRNSAVYAQLFKARLAYYVGSGKRLSSTVSDTYLAAYVNSGFVVKSKRGSFTTVERIA